MPGLPQVNTSGTKNIVESGLKRKAVTSWDHKIKLSQTEIADLWIAAGGSVDKADLMSAISMAESSGIVRAGLPGACCHGLWQFNTSVGVSTMACAQKPSCAAREAVKMSQDGTELQPWEAYTNGAYKKFLGKSHALAVGSEGISLRGPAELVGKVTDPLTSIVGFIAKLFDPTVWLRVGKAIAGFLLLAFGAITLMKVLVGVDIPTGAVSAGKLAAGLAA